MGTELPTYYTNISDLPLRVYKDVAIRGNFAALIKTGMPTMVDLQVAWMNIQEEYAEKIGNKELYNYWLQNWQIGVIRAKMKQVEICVERITQVGFMHDMEPDDKDYTTYLKFFGDSLNELVRADFDFMDPLEREKNLGRSQNRAKSMIIELELKEIEFKNVEAKVAKGEPISDAYFDSILITLSDNVHYRLDDSITVFEFCERLRRLQAQNK